MEKSKPRRIIVLIMTMITLSLMSCGGPNSGSDNNTFEYANERFADLQMLRYRVDGFENLSLNQKLLIYYLSEAALYGRDIFYDQNGAYNLRIRKMLETIYQDKRVNHETEDFQEMEEYLKRVWFSNGIHHHYASDKFAPGFRECWFREQWERCATPELAAQIDVDEICKVMFDFNVMHKRVNLAAGEDLVQTSASNYYQGVTQEEAERFYEKQKAQWADKEHPGMFGMNSRLVKLPNGEIVEKRWTASGLYGEAITKILEYLGKARKYAEDKKQVEVIDKLTEFYKTGDLATFDQYSIAWVENTAPMVDFVNGFIECYGDPLGLKCAWESIVNFKDIEATKRTECLSANAQWFEDNSPIDDQFKKKNVKGITAKVITAAILGGDLFPSTAIGINLPNSNWIRKEHGSKSVTIGNLTHAYNQAGGSGMRQEFCISKHEVEMMDKYSELTSDLHTDLHECLGHGSGKMMSGVEDDSLKAYGSTIEEARADLFALYYLADEKMVELGLIPDADAYKAEYYQYMMNGLITQLVRIQPGKNIEEAHMRNRSLIAHWCLEKGKEQKTMVMVNIDNKTFVRINSYTQLRELLGELLKEVQRIKSTGDYQAAKELVETYGVKVNQTLHHEVLSRYDQLNLAPYKGFINPRYTLVTDKDGNATDVTVDYTESYADQMLRYSRDYSTLPLVNN